MDKTGVKLQSSRTSDGPLELARTGLLCVLGFLFAIVVLPILLLLSLIFRLYRHSLYNKILEETGGDAIIAGGDDAVWFQDSPKNTGVINSILFLKGQLDIEKIRKICNDRIVEAKDEDGNLIAAKFSYYATKMYHRYVWLKDKDFDIKNHVTVWNKSTPKTQTDIEDIMSEVSSIKLPANRSPWQIIVVPCFKSHTSVDSDSGNDTVVIPVIFRVHHAIADGVSLIKLMMQQVLDSPNTTKQLPKKFASKGFGMRVLKAVFTGPTMILGRIFWPTDRHALHGPDLTGRKVFTWSENIDLELIKRMKNAAGVTVNDILMSCLAGSFYQYFRKHASHIPEDIVTYVPVDIRSPNAKLVVDNQFALVFLKLPINVSDRMQRLADTKARMEKIKVSAEPLINALIIRYLMSRYPNWLTKALFDSIGARCSMVVSNVPGPQQACYMAGLELEQMVFWPPQRANVGIGISILSYNGVVKTGIMMDRRLLSNPSILLDEFEKEVMEMAKQLNVLDDSNSHVST